MFLFFSSADMQRQHVSIKEEPVLLSGVDGLTVTAGVRSWSVKIRFRVSDTKEQRQMNEKAHI